MNEDYKKIRDIENTQETDNLINYILTILNIKTSTEQDLNDLQVQMLVASDFIKTKFGFLTIPEIQEAFKMFVARQFPEIKVFRILDCVVIGEVLNAFIEYRNDSLRIYDQKKTKIMLEQNRTLTPEEIEAKTINGINLKYHEYIEKKDIEEPFSWVFKELVERAIIKMPTAQTPKLSMYFDNKLTEAREQILKEAKYFSSNDKKERQTNKQILDSILSESLNQDAKIKIEIRAKKLVLIDFFKKQIELKKENVL